MLNSIPLFKNPIASYHCGTGKVEWKQEPVVQGQELGQGDQKQQSVMEDSRSKTAG